jgi:colanic acid biosynthesis glycosyl transferase WcaI
MGPIATIWATTMRDRGHVVEVVTAHPHYPGPLWGHRVRPYREVRDGVAVTRLPLWIGHATTKKRIREELTYMAAAALVTPTLPTPDVIVAVSPAFLALVPTMMNVRARRIPWVLWLQDIFPDAAMTTGLVRNRVALRAARWLEALAYRAADRIVVISETFEENLRRKGVPAGKLTLIYNPATRGFGATNWGNRTDPPRILYMGNMGFSQGLVELVRAFQDPAVANAQFRLVITGAGELEGSVRDAIRSDRIEFLGLISPTRLDSELSSAVIGLVTQRPDIVEFNVPSKLMTLMARGIPVLASVRRGSEVERIVTTSGGGWVSDAASPSAAAQLAAQVVRDPDDLRRRGAAALAFARKHFGRNTLAEGFEVVLSSLVRRAEPVSR